ncbi:fimbrial protein [Pseudomonas sp. CR3202]|uniref:fimbrial protein n=1 Tax=Pseudomonas sp. CR3202 TaxID=3351532 RepID=UPI003BF3B890
MKDHSPLLRGLAVLVLAMPGFAFGGQCSPDDGTHSFDFLFNQTFYSPEENRPQMLMPNAHTWDLGGQYRGGCKCNKPNTIVPEIFYTAKSDLAKGYTAAVNGVDMQFFKVNRNIQVAGEVWIDGRRTEFVPIPFTSVSNMGPSEDGHPFQCRANGEVRVIFDTGKKGRLHLMIDKPFIGESVIPKTKLLELRGTVENTSPTGATPLADVWMSGTVTVPQSCELAPGQVTTIDFGNLNPWEVAEPGETPQRTVSRTFNIQCKNISEMVAVNLVLEGNPHDVQTNALAVNDRSDLAIILKNNGRIVPPLREFATPKPENLVPLDFNQVEQKTQFDLEAYPIKAEKYVDPGEFKSQVTLKFEFE